MAIVQQTGRQAWILLKLNTVCSAHVLGTYYVHCSEAPKGLIETVKNCPSLEGHLSWKKKTTNNNNNKKTTQKNPNHKWTDNKQWSLKLFSCLFYIFTGEQNWEVAEAFLHRQNLKSTCYKLGSSYTGDSGVHPHQKLINLSKILMVTYKKA